MTKPTRAFNGTIGQPSTGVGGPDYIEADLDKLFDKTEGVIPATTYGLSASNSAEANTTAINAVIADLDEGDTLYIPPGTYSVNALTFKLTKDYSVYLAGTINMEGSLTFPSNVAVQMGPQGMFTKSDGDGYTLKIQGTFKGSLTQHFYCSASETNWVSFDNGVPASSPVGADVPEVCPEWFGAKGDGSTDDTHAIQAAENAADTCGAIIRFQSKTYIISSAISTHQQTQWEGNMLEPSYWPDASNDLEKEFPSYNGLCTIIQYEQGSHGAVLSPSSVWNRTSVRGIVFRVSQTRTSADWVIDPSNTTGYLNARQCIFENFYGVVDSSILSWTEYWFWDVRVFSCEYGFKGIVIDSQFVGCTFSTCSYPFEVTALSAVRFAACRWEWNTNAIMNIGSGTGVTLTDCAFDANYAALRLEGIDATQITGCQFRRQGIGSASPAEGYRSHIYIKDYVKVAITGCSFDYAGDDNNAAPYGPWYIIEFNAPNGAFVEFKGNNTYLGYTKTPFCNPAGNTWQVLDWDICEFVPDLVPDSSFYTTFPNTNDDTLSETCNDLRRLTIENCKGILRIWNGYSKDTRKLTATTDGTKVELAGKNWGSPINVNTASYGITLASADYITVTDGTTSRTYYEKDGQTYCSSAPTGAQNTGWWETGKRIYDSAPSAGGTIGWVNVGSNTWKAFGTIAT